jgi:ferrochelatase
VPIGFVSDHLEILYDIDVRAQGLANSRGLTLVRSESLNASPTFIRALAEIVKARVKTR